MNWNGLGEFMGGIFAMRCFEYWIAVWVDGMVGA